MKRIVLALFLGLVLAGCGGGGSRGGDNVTITLQGTVFQGDQQGGLGGGGNPLAGATVTVVQLNRAATTPIGGGYSIPDVPVGGNYTVTVTEQNNALVNASCAISIPDSTTLTVTGSTGGTCTRVPSAAGILALNITVSTGP